MTRVISISTDRNIFTEGSAVRARHVEYGALFDELHIVVFTTLGARLPAKVQIAPNVWVYGTRSFAKIFHINRAIKVAQQILRGVHDRSIRSIITTQDPFETGAVGVRLKKLFNFPLHVQIHTDFLNPHFARASVLNRMRVRMSKSILPQADAVRIVSKKIAQSIVDSKEITLRVGVVPVVLPIFVDVSKIEQASTDPQFDLKKKYPQFNFIILMASRLTAEKNIPFAINTFKKLVDIYPRAGMVVVGSGPLENSLKSLVRGLNMAQNVVFEPWQHDLVSYYKTANLFLLTSNFEGYGLTLIEAVAAGCPVVSTDVGVASELLRDGITSPVCEIGDMGCFFDNIVRMIENPALRSHIVYEARQRLERVVVASKEQYLKEYCANIESAALSSQQPASL